MPDTAWFPKTHLVTLPEPFIDDRGEIQPLADVTMQSALIIHSKKGAIRANHYHKEDWHFDHVVSGEFEYYWREVGDTNPPQKIVVGPGQTVFSPPMVEHALLFTKDTTQVVLSGNPRDQAAYEEDVIRVKLI